MSKVIDKRMNESSPSYRKKKAKRDQESAKISSVMCVVCTEPKPGSSTIEGKDESMETNVSESSQENELESSDIESENQSAIQSGNEREREIENPNQPILYHPYTWN